MSRKRAENPDKERTKRGDGGMRKVLNITFVTTSNSTRPSAPGKNLKPSGQICKSVPWGSPEYERDIQSRVAGINEEER